MLKLHGYFKNGCIVQRGKPFKVSGFSDGEVILTLKGGDFYEMHAVAPNNGKFAVNFKAVGDTVFSYVLTAVCGDEKISVTLKFGDVYVAMGQSNMSYALSAAEDYEEWLMRADKAYVAFLNLAEPEFKTIDEVTRPAFPLEDLRYDYDWTSGGGASEVSALAVISATIISEKKKIPVGFVQTAMGGLGIEAYLKRETAENDPDLIEVLKEAGRYIAVEDYNKAGGRNYSQLSGVWNEKIAPLKGLNFAGVAWYLGESSAADFRFARAFEKELEMVISDFKSEIGDIPFAAVHIAPEYYPYGDGYGYLYVNEAISRVEKKGVYSLPIYDIEPRWLKPNGDTYFHPIHPVNKAPVAERIAAAFTGGRTVYPQITDVVFCDGKAVCTVSEELFGGPIFGFTLAGENGKYYSAKAFAEGNKITVVSEDVFKPKFITYAFVQYQDFCNARAKDGAPLAPYRSVCEQVGDNYFFPPAFTVAGAAEVYENNFGWQVGTCGKVKVWKQSAVYGTTSTEIKVADGEVLIEATPKREEYKLFGISPEFCLAGHKSHFADYGYLNFYLCADADAEFYGVIFRAAGGGVYRADLMNAGENADVLPILTEYRRYSVRLSGGQNGDYGAMKFTDELRKSFVQAEFLFRSRTPVTVRLKNIEYSDTDRSDTITKEKEQEALRGDLNLPQN